MSEERRRTMDPFLEIIVADLKSMRESQDRFQDATNLQMGRIVSHLESEVRYRAGVNGVLKSMDEALSGNGHPGLKTRVDRLEQNEDRRRRHFMMIWAGVASSIGMTIWNVLKRLG